MIRKPFWANWFVPQSFSECLTNEQQIRYLAKKNAENEEEIKKVDEKTLPEGGNPGEVLIKASSEEYDAEWAPGGSGGATPVIDANASVTQDVGTASVEVTKTGTISNPIFNFAFTGIKGAKGDEGDAGKGIQSIVKTATSGLVDTYTITYTDETTSTFNVTNGAKGDEGDAGNGIQSVVKTATSGLIDTYTITYTNGTTTTFNVKNGAKGDPGENGITPVISATATVDSTTGTPAVQVTKTGTDAAPSFEFAFTGLKGEGGGSGGTSDYDDLDNKPSINNVTLTGDKTLAELGIEDEIITLTQAQYDALDPAPDPTKTYFISDAQAGPTLGSAASKNYTDRVMDSTDLVESRAVLNAISSSLSSIFTPKGAIDFADLTSDLLIPANVGNVYETNDAGVTDSNWVQAAGTSIPAQSTVAIISADRIRFNYQGASVFNLSDYQTKALETPVTIGGVVRSTVQTALSAIVDVIDTINQTISSLAGRVTTLEGVKIKRKVVDVGGIAINQGGGSSGIYYKDNVDLGLTDSEFLVSVSWNGAWSEDVILVPNTRKLGLVTRVSGKTLPTGRTVNVFYI